MSGKDINIDFDTREFSAALDKLHVGSRRSFGALVDEQFRGFARVVIDLTPPARGGRRGMAAQRAGRKTLDNDVHKVFQVAHYTQKELEFGEMHAELKRNRRGKGIRAIEPSKKKKVLKGDINRLKKQLYKEVGFLAGGFFVAMKRFRVARVPAWIRRHTDAPGKGSLVVSTNAVVGEMINSVKYATGVYGLVRRVALALRIQTRNMNKRVEFQVAEAAKIAGFPVS